MATITRTIIMIKRQAPMHTMTRVTRPLPTTTVRITKTTARNTPTTTVPPAQDTETLRQAMDSPSSLSKR